MLISTLPKIHIVSSFGYRDRIDNKTGKLIKGEFHPGIDVRVFDKKNDPAAKIIFPVLAPEQVRISAINFSPRWGHEIRAAVVEENELGVIEFRFWHVKPLTGLMVGMIIAADTVIGNPEAGYVSLHLHFETRIDYAGMRPVDPLKYLALRGIAYE